MFCTKCGCKNDNAAGFCSQCGNPLTAPSQDSGPLPQEKLPEKDVNKEQPRTESKSKGGNHKKQLLQWLIPGALLLVAVVTAVILFVKPKKARVLDDILEALKGTLNAKSFAFDLDATENYGDSDIITHAEGLAEYDLKKGLLMLDMKTDDNTEFIIYDNKIYYLEDDELFDWRNLSYGLRYFFQYYKEYEGALTSFKDVDWEEAIEESGLSYYLFEDEVADCLNELREKLNDKAFYQEVCNKFEIKTGKGETTYRFDFNTGKLAKEVYDILKPAFKKDIDEDVLLEQFKDIRKCSLELSIGKERLTSLSFSFKYSDGSDVESISLSLKLKDYDKASFDKTKMAAIAEMEPKSRKYEATTAPAPDISRNTTEADVDYSYTVPTPVPYRSEDTNFSADLELWYVEGTEPYIIDAVERFLEDNPSCNVNVVSIDAFEYDNMLATAIAAGTAPDIFISPDNYQFYSYILNDLIIDLTDYMRQKEYDVRYMEAALAQAGDMGRYYGVPTGSVSMYGMFYNKDIFSRLGLEVPATIDELEEVCDTLLANGITPFAFANASRLQGSMLFTCLAARRTGVEPLETVPYKDTDPLEIGYEYAGNKIQQWVRAGYLMEDYSHGYDEEARGYFANEVCAMYLYDCSAVYDLRDLMPYSSSLGFFPFPAYTEGDDNSRLAIGFVGYDKYCISSYCTAPYAAFELITYLVDDDVILDSVSETYLPPTTDFYHSRFDDVYYQVQELAMLCDDAMAAYETYLPAGAARVHWDNLADIFDLNGDPLDLFYKVASEIR